MNYVFNLKQQLMRYGLYVLISVTSYAFARYFGWREAIILTPGLISAIVSGSLMFIFIGPMISPWNIQSKK